MKISIPGMQKLNEILAVNHVSCFGNMSATVLYLPAIHENAPTWQEQYICHIETADKLRYCICTGPYLYTRVHVDVQSSL